MCEEIMVVPDSVKNLPEEVGKLLKLIQDSRSKMEFLEKEMFQIKNLEESILQRQKSKMQKFAEFDKKIGVPKRAVSDHNIAAEKQADTNYKIPQQEEVNV